MINSECRTQECPLADLARDVPAVVVGVPDGIGALGWHGVRPGAVLTVAADAPLGGPRIVRLGGTRLAIGRTLTRSITVRPVGGAGGTDAANVVVDVVDADAADAVVDADGSPSGETPA